MAYWHPLHIGILSASTIANRAASSAVAGLTSKQLIMQRTCEKKSASCAGPSNQRPDQQYFHQISGGAVVVQLGGEKMRPGRGIGDKRLSVIAVGERPK